MRAAFEWTLVIAFCCSLSAPAEEARFEESLAQARKDFDEAKALDTAGKYDEALLLVERALQIRERARGPNHREVAECLNLLGRLQWRRGKYAEAEPPLQRARQIWEAVLGKNHPDVAQSLNNLANLYTDQGSYEQAEPLYQRAIQIREAALGTNHPDVAQSLNNLANLYSAQGAYPRAVSLHQHALRIRETALGPNHPDVAQSLNNLADLYSAQGSYNRAEPLYQRAIQIRESALGTTHPHVATSLDSLATMYWTQGFYQRAEPLYQRALQIREVALGKNHPDVAQSLNSLVNFYWTLGSYERAESLAERALRIQEETLGKNHHDVAQSLINLANLYRAEGSYERTEPLYQRALQIREATLGPGHPEVAQALNNLADLYKAEGSYERAEPLYQRALQIWNAALGENHPYIAVSINNLADLYRVQGSYKRAEPLYRRALQIWEAALGKHHPDIATSLDNFAAHYCDQGAYEQAESLFQRALEIREAVLGKNHPDVATSLNNLADIYLAQGSYARAEPLYQSALRIREAGPGKNHPDVALSLNNLATLYRVQGLYDQAEPLLKRALRIRETILGKNHPDVTVSLHELGKLYLAKGQFTAAFLLLHRAFAASEGRLRREALALSEARLAGLLDLLRRQDEALYNQLREYPSEVTARRLALAIALLRKGRSVNEIADTSRAIYRILGESDRQALQRLRALRTQFASLSLAGPGKLSPADYQTRLKELETQGDVLEAELAHRSALLRAQRQLPDPNDVIDRVATALPPAGALVEIIVFNASPVAPPHGTAPSKVPSTPIYFALVLLPSGDIRAVDLGPAAVIDSAVGRLRDALASPDGTYLPAAQELYRLVFQPIAPLLGSQRHLFVSPDGQLGLIPWAALHDGTRFLVDTFDWTYLTSGKDLLRRSEEFVPSNSVMVFADPDFGTSSTSTATQSAPAAAPRAVASKERSYAVERFFARRREGWTDLPLVPLPGTRQEAEAIRKLTPAAHLVMGKAATKEAFLQVAAPGILHVATHGFFLEDTSTPPAVRGIGSFGELGGGNPRQTPSDPLLRSGLVLAGARAQATPAGAAGPSGRHRMENSLVTALEIAGMNLWGTQLVVLSACETGRGDVKLGQGVYGLRRAFTVAGAETLVTSLWKVNDETTHELMKGYYQRLLGGAGRAHALREAMEGVRMQHPHPYYWAPFIVVGNGASLRGLAPSRAATPRPKP
jgi:tetratricopeptide (TPR) repeat protein